MIVVDTSAIIAILNREPDRPALIEAMTRADALRMAAPILVEATAVAQRWGDWVARDELPRVLSAFQIVIADTTAEHAEIARQAYLRFGKGLGARAQLNICDCFSYALAKSRDAPLLFKGEQFSHTDVRSALESGAS